MKTDHNLIIRNVPILFKDFKSQIKINNKYLKKLKIAFLGLSANFSTGHSSRNFRDLLRIEKRENFLIRVLDTALFLK